MNHRLSVFVVFWAIVSCSSFTLAYSWSANPGNGTAADPWQISTVEQLEAISDDLGLLDDHFVMTADIAYPTNDPNGAGFINHVPIGNETTPFTGTFDGNDHSITNLTVYQADPNVPIPYAGFFGYIEGDGTTNSIKDLTLHTPYIELRMRSGYNSYNSAGSLAGYNYNTLISNCHVDAGVVVDYLSGDSLGGLIGVNHSGDVLNCSSDVELSGDRYLGGLAGKNRDGDISNCYATGSVSGGNYLGGLVGHNRDGDMSNCYATSNVSGGSYLGGLVGYGDGGTISSCYATGSVSGGNLGGLVGYDYGSSITDSYWDIQTSGLTSSAGGTGLTTEQMQTHASFVGWDFSSVEGDPADWVIYPDSYPILAWQNPVYTEVSDVVGLSIANAIDLLAQGNLNYSIVYEFSDSPAGQVMAQSPTAGQEVLEGSVVILTIAKPYVVVPDMSAMTIEQAQETLVDLGLTSQILYEYSVLSEGSLIAQDPESGTLVDLGTLVVLTYSLGPLSVGDGSIENPWQISTVEQLEAISGGCGLLDDHFVMTADIAYPTNDPNGAGFINHVPIGDEATPFTGTFDGNGHSITNLTVYQADPNVPIPYAGLFGYIEGDGTTNSIKDLTLHTPYLELRIRSGYNSYNYAGSLAGYTYNTLISNCHVDAGVVVDYLSGGRLGGLIGVNDSGDVLNCSSDVELSGDYYLGSLVGENRDGDISNCYATGCVSGDWYLGGLVGENRDGDISNCYATSNVSGRNYLGGLVGYNRGGDMSNCYATGSVSGSYYLGGLVGYGDGSTISSCYATGSVLGDRYLGGLVGYGDGSTISSCYATGSVSGDYYLGGLVGHNWLGTLSTCYATGDVSGEEDLGGLVGYNSGAISTCYATGDVSGEEALGGLVGTNYGTVTDSYWDIQTSGLTSSVGGTGLTTEQMQTQANFVGWDFGNIWGIREGLSYPFLQWQPHYNSNPDFFEPAGVGLEDFAYFASYWLMGDCSLEENDYCYGTDMNGSGTVDLDDLLILTDQWLFERPFSGDPNEQLIGWWKLDGNADDSSGNGYHGRCYIDPNDPNGVQSPNWVLVDGDNYAIELDGVDDYMAVPGYKGISGGASRTCAAWIKTSTTPGEILSWGEDYQGGRWIVRVNEGGQLRAEVQGGNIIGTTLINDGQWHHVAVVLIDDGSTDINEAQLYVDGHLETISASVDEPVNTGAYQDVQIGMYYVGQRWFDGLIDDVRIYDVALTDEQIAELAMP